MTTDETTPLNQYLQPLFAYKLLIVVVTAVVVALGLFVGTTASKTYMSETSILVFPISGDPTKALESDDTEVEMDTELRIATSQAVMSIVTERLEAQSIVLSREALEASVSASTTKESRILDIAFEGSSPEIAQAGAAAFADSYLDFRSDLATTSKLESETAINARIVVLKEELAAVTTRLNATPETSSSAVILEVEQRSISGELVAQQSALADLSTLTIDATKVIDPARLPISPGGLSLLQTLVGALTAGLVLGVVSAYLLAAFDGANQPHNRRIADKQTPQLMESLQGVISAVTSAAGSVSDAKTDSGHSQSGKSGQSESGQTKQTPPEPTPEPTAPTGVSTIAAAAIDMPAPPQPEPVVEIAAEPAPEPVQPAAAVPTPPTAVEEPAPEAQAEVEPVAVAVPAALQGQPVDDQQADDQQVEGEPVEFSSVWTPREPEPTALMVSPNMEELISTLQALGAVGPVVGLSVGETSGATALAVAFDLAGELQGLGARVLIVDAAIEDPMLHSLLRVEAGPGLADVLSGSITFEDAIQPLADLEGLDALTIGAATTSTAAAMASPAFEELLAKARADYHSVLIVSGTLDEEQTVPALARQADGLILSTGRGPGGPVSGELCNKLADLDVPTLDIISTASRIEEAIVGASSM